MSRSHVLYHVVWVLMVLVGIAGFTSSIEGWVVMQSTGDPGCRVKIGREEVVVDTIQRKGSHCDQRDLLGATVLAIDGVPVTANMSPRALVDLVFQEPSTVHRWKVSRPGGTVEEVDLRYEFGPLAVALEEVGDMRADVLSSAMVVVGAWSRTVVFVVAGIVLFRIGMRRRLVLLMSGAAFAYVFGLTFETELDRPWHTMLHDLAVLSCVVATSTLLISAPGVKLRSRFSLGLAIAWSLATVLWLDPVLMPWDGPGGDWELRGHLSFLWIGVAMLIHRSLGLRRAEQNKLRWIIVTMIAGGFVLVPLAVPIFSEAGTELVRILVWPVTEAMLPLAVLHSLDEESPWDVERVVRRTAQAGVLLTTLSLLILLDDGLLHEAVNRLWPTALQGMPVWTAAMIGLVTSVLLTTAAARPLMRMTDTLLFPGRTDADRYHAEALRALEDCWDLADVVWCARSVARAAVGSDGGRLLIWRSWIEALPGEPAPSVALRDAAAGVLERGEAASFDEPGREDEPALLVPLVRAGERIGVLVVPCPSDHLLTRRERVFLETLAAPFAQALWQHTRAAPIRARVAG